MCGYNVIWPSQGIHVLMYAHQTILTCFWNIKFVRLVMCVCVCVCVCFGSKGLTMFLVERWLWKLKNVVWIFCWVTCFYCIHVCVFLFLEKLFLPISTTLDRWLSIETLGFLFSIDLIAFFIDQSFLEFVSTPFS